MAMQSQVSSSLNPATTEVNGQESFLITQMAQQVSGANKSQWQRKIRPHESNKHAINNARGHTPYTQPVQSSPPNSCAEWWLLLPPRVPNRVENLEKPTQLSHHSLSYTPTFSQPSRQHHRPLPARNSAFIFASSPALRNSSAATPFLVGGLVQSNL